MYVVNDLHGAPALIGKTVEAIGNLEPGETLVINGDGAGARGPIMNKVVKIFYEVRRGETDARALQDTVGEIIGKTPEIPQEWVYETVHAGLFRKLMAERYERFASCMQKELKEVIDETLQPLAEAADKRNVRIVYLPGNGEIVPDDFSTDDITTECAVHPKDRFYYKLAREGYFEQRFGVRYVPYTAALSSGNALISTNLLDLDDKSIHYQLESHGLLDMAYSKVIVHYPPAIAPIGGAFNFWTPNKSDVRRIEVLNKVLSQIKLTNDVVICFGHIHLGANDSRMNPYPDIMGFRVNDRRCAWVKPGTVIKI